MKHRLSPLLNGLEMSKSEHDWLEQRFENMTAKEELLFQGAMQIENPRTAQETIQILQGLDHYRLLYGADDDVALGRFVMEHIHTPTHAARGYKAGSLGDPATACAEELVCVYNNIYNANYTGIDDLLDGISFLDRAQYILDLGERGVWGDCAVYEYTYAGPGTNNHPANDVQAIMIGELNVTHEQYELTVKKVDSTNPSKGLPGARFLIQSANGSYSKEVVTGSDGT